MPGFNSYSNSPTCYPFSTSIPRWTTPCSHSSGRLLRPRFKPPSRTYGLESVFSFRLKRLGDSIAIGVVSFQRIPADPEQFSKHADAVAQRMDARSLAMRPRDGNLADGKPELSGQVKQFRIKSPTLDLLQRKNSLCAAPSESLKAALRVFVLQAQNYAQRQIEDSPEDSAMQRLPPNLQSTIHPSRADGNVRTLRHRRKQLVRLLNRRRQVRIAEHQDVSPRVHHSVADAVSFAAISGIL